MPTEPVKPAKPVRLAAKPLEVVKPDYNLKYLRFLVFGDTGVGKTVLVASAQDVPELSPVLFCDADLGTKSIVDRDIDVVPIRSMKDLENVNRYVRANPGEYNTVVVDGLTALYNQIIRARIGAPNRSKKEDPYVPGMADWLHGTFRLRVLIQQFKTAPVNFLATALVDERMDEFTDMPRIQPGLSKKLAREVGAEFDLVGFLSVRIRIQKIVRVLQLDPFGAKAAKQRATPGYRLPSLLDNPTMNILYRRSVLGEPLEDLLPDGGKEEGTTVKAVKKVGSQAPQSA